MTPGRATTLTRTRADVERDLLAWMAEPSWKADDARFDRIARDLFAIQCRTCAPYGAFCASRGVTPDSLGDWRSIPAVPTGAFKEVALRGFPAEATVRTFRTSGTTTDRRGALHLDTLALYEASLLASLRTLMFPDVGDGADTRPDRVAMRILTPSADEAPDSSLSHMFAVLLARHGAVGSGFVVVDGRLDVDACLDALRESERLGEPLALCGTAFAFVHLLDALDERGLRFACAPGSRIMETGGFKGRSRELPRDELCARLAASIGVPERRIVNQYGMTELGSQFYDSVLLDPDGPRRKLGPPWARVRIVDPETGSDVADGAVGMVVVHDLANTGSVAAIQTADLGRQLVDARGRIVGFEVIGREPAAEARGCSIAADEMLSVPGR